MKPIDIRNYSKDIIEIESSFANIKEKHATLDNKVETFTCKNIDLICDFAKEELKDQEIMLVIGSKKIGFQDELNQELAFAKYLLAYIIIALKTLSKGGSLVLRTYDQNLPFTCAMLFILYKSFDELTIIKPLSSNLHSAVSHYY